MTVHWLNINGYPRCAETVWQQNLFRVFGFTSSNRIFKDPSFASTTPTVTCKNCLRLAREDIEAIVAEERAELEPKTKL